jgi:hypothetical protein
VTTIVVVFRNMDYRYRSNLNVGAQGEMETLKWRLYEYQVYMYALVKDKAYNIVNNSSLLDC